MNKTIRILTIIATALVACSLLILLIAIPFQRMLAMGVFGYNEYVVAALPMFPLMPFVKCLLRLVFVALLIICCGNRKGGIWMELVILAIMVFAIPGVEKILAAEHNLTLALRGADYVAANGIVSSISAYCMAPANLGMIVAYVSCGMSIAFKRMSKKMAQEEAEEAVEEIPAE